MDIGLFIKKAAECDVVSHCTECLAMLFFDQEVEGKVSPLKVAWLVRVARRSPRKCAERGHSP